MSLAREYKILSDLRAIMTKPLVFNENDIKSMRYMKASCAIVEAMEKSLEKHMTNVLNNHGVTGIICVDNNGFCVGVKGSGEVKSAGTLTAISQIAQKVLPGSETPVVSIESSSTNILIKSHEGYTTAIYKQT